MILYFDSYITDIPLPGRSRDLLPEDIRKNCMAYKMPKRVDIAKYTLESYALYPWSHVFIRYELDNKKDIPEFDRFIKRLFPNLTIMHQRSDSQGDYKESLKILKKMNDPWIFYSPNNDHPITSSDKNIVSYLSGLIKKAEQWKKKYSHVSIMYSHFSEFLNIPVKGTPEHFLHGRNTLVLEENQEVLVYLMPHGDFSSVQITHIDTMEEWFSSANMEGKRVIRAEDMRYDSRIEEQVIIAPKKEICAHFDGYEHMVGYPNEIAIDLIPPLFIPNGFFKKMIRIAYGYDTYREGWVNINPSAKEYSFRNRATGTDLKIALSGIPLFWKPNIKTIDNNPSVDQKKLTQAANNRKAMEMNPWSFKYQQWNMRTIRYWVRYWVFFVYVHCRIILRNLGIKKLIRMVQ